MTEALTSTIESETGRLAQIDDPVERFRAARDFRDVIAVGDAAAREIERVAVGQLKEGRPWRAVGELLGISGSRAEQIAKGR
ncbi:hypothetical protein [Streptomyces sp. WAC01280]|jgi:hypothetical protein|uniref:hypothetical protein n=1 Tax=Streptomyces sp. WAC01280 TaxID=2487424 RepID=UPI000F76B23D|nr:hypothetical protein [Streptomyces sp. WAC01280]RSS59813.1 hypothetical protein EF909_08100 [Streptomyces sp. WAC01280]